MAIWSTILSRSGTIARLTACPEADLLLYEQRVDEVQSRAQQNRQSDQEARWQSPDPLSCLGVSYLRVASLTADGCCSVQPSISSIPGEAPAKTHRYWHRRSSASRSTSSVRKSQLSTMANAAPRSPQWAPETSPFLRGVGLSSGSSSSNIVAGGSHTTPSSPFRASLHAFPSLDGLHPLDGLDSAWSTRSTGHEYGQGPARLPGGGGGSGGGGGGTGDDDLASFFASTSK